jgi:hypothetical protein
MPDDPIRSLWNRVRALGRKVEEEVYDFTEEDAEREEEPRGRNTVIALLNAFLTMWKASQANVGERTLVSPAAGSLAHRRRLRPRHPQALAAHPAITFAGIWFVPGIIAAGWTLFGNLGAENLKRLRTWPLIGVFALTGLIGFPRRLLGAGAPAPAPGAAPRPPARIPVGAGFQTARRGEADRRSALPSFRAVQRPSARRDNALTMQTKEHPDELTP